MKKLLLKILPPKILILLRFFLAIIRNTPHFFYDLRAYSKYSVKQLYPIQSKDQMITRIITLYHVIEKGLSMPKPRIGFGKERIQMLINLLELYRLNGYDTNNVHYSSGIKVLESYLKYHKNEKLDLNYIRFFLSSIKNYDKDCIGGVLDFNTLDFINNYSGSFKNLVKNRHSIRNFINREVPQNILEESIKIAQKSPSTCNRQPTKVYIFENKNTIKKVLEIQNGSKGFDEKINKLLMLVFDIKAYQGEGDRNSGYIDSSLFGMTLIYSLLEKGIGSISLNWSKSMQDDKKLRNLLDLPENLRIVFFLGIGYLPKTLKVPVSTRSDLKNIIYYYDKNNNS